MFSLSFSQAAKNALPQHQSGSEPTVVHSSDIYATSYTDFLTYRKSS